MDPAQLAGFVRTRREALQPEDVGLPRGPRRRGPSEQMLGAIAGGLHLTPDERVST